MIRLDIAKPAFAFIFLFLLVMSGADCERLQAQETAPLSATQWIQCDTDGVVQLHVVVPKSEGEMAPVPHADVFLMGRKEVRFHGHADSDGLLKISGVPAGVYAVVAKSESSLGVYSLHVLDASYNGHKLYPTSATIACATVSNEQFEETTERHATFEYALDDLEIDQKEPAPIVNHTRGNERFRVLLSGGSLEGYIYQSTGHGISYDSEDQEDRLDPAESTRVFLFDGKNLLGRAVTDEEGRFLIHDASPGVLSILAVGPHGIGSMGIEVIEETKLSQNNSTATHHFVSKVQMGGSSFSMQVVPACASCVVSQPCCVPARRTRGLIAGGLSPRAAGLIAAGVATTTTGGGPYTPPEAASEEIVTP